MPKGDIVLITFPFTNLSGSKLRPAINSKQNYLLLSYNLDYNINHLPTTIKSPWYTLSNSDEPNKTKYLPAGSV